jgi:NADH-quinone oxidoreductase subunit C
LPDESLLDLAEYISEKLEKHVVSHEFIHSELIIHTIAESITPVLQFLRDARECEFTTLCDICGVDYFGKPTRFEVVYSLLSLRQNNRIRVKISVNEGQIIPSVTDLFRSALWYEREIWDMFGVLFSDNPDLRRILTDYGFSGYPLRKDFPLMGHVELRYDEEQKRVVYEPVHLDQDYRDFNFLSPWEGMTDVQLEHGEKSENQQHGYRGVKEELCDSEKEGGKDHASEK